MLMGFNLEILLNPKKFSAISWSMVEKCFDSKTVASSSFGSTLRMGQQNCGCGPCEKDIRHSIQKAMVILLSQPQLPAGLLWQDESEKSGKLDDVGRSGYALDKARQCKIGMR